MMAGGRVGFLAAAAWVSGCYLAGMASLSCVNAWSARTFTTGGFMRDKVFTGDGVLTSADVSGLTCARQCLRELVYGFYFYNPSTRACVWVPSGTSKNLTGAPGYLLYRTSDGPSGTPSANDRKMCPSNTHPPPHGCWKGEMSGDLTFRQVSVGQAGVWAVQDETDDIYHFSGTYQNPVAFAGNTWVNMSAQADQLDVGTDAVWMAYNTSLRYRADINSTTPLGDSWRSAMRAYGSMHRVSVTPQGNVWAVNHVCLIVHGLNAARIPLPLGQWEAVETNSGMQKLDAGRAGVWTLDFAGRLYYRLGTYGQENDGMTGTGGWERVGWGRFNSVSSGRDLVLAVDTAGHVWLRTCMGADTPASLGWAWLSGAGDMKQAEIYQAGDVTAIWALDGLKELHFFLL